MTTTHRRLAGITLPLLLALATAAPAAASPADPIHRPPTGPTTYQIIELPAPAGGSGSGMGITNNGMVTGHVQLPTGQRRAAMWSDGQLHELGTLGGPNSAVLWPVDNSRGIIVGVAETAEQDPNGEAWSCSAFLGYTGHVCTGFVWERGQMRALPTFGGTHGFATGVNNRAHAVGWAELAEPDPTCNQVNQFLGFRAALWDLRNDQVQQLPPLAGDSASAATAINDRGQVVGISGDCANAVGGYTARHAVMWDNGQVIDLGHLGGEAWNTPMALNNRGMVVGFANQDGVTGGAFLEEAFAWTSRDGIRGLGWLPGDTRSQALGINDRGDIVGLSVGDDGARAAMWRGDHAMDLNALAPGYDGHLVHANHINNAGVITGQAINANGHAVAYLAVPLR